jgi:hypothetical protein
MPEGPEVETENLRDKIHEKLEQDGGPSLNRIALATALFAALAAIAALRAGGTKRSPVLKTEAQAGRRRPVGLLPGQGNQGGDRRGARLYYIAKEPPAEYAEKEKRYEQRRDPARRPRSLKERDARSARPTTSIITTDSAFRRLFRLASRGGPT